MSAYSTLPQADLGVPPWYGLDPVWTIPLERDARRRFGPHLVRRYGRGVLHYSMANLEVVGRGDGVSLEIQFHAKPPYNTFGLPPEQYPHVFADRLLDSPHRLGDGSLCLFDPKDPAEMRWVPANGLLSLIALAQKHVTLETLWRHEGGHGKAEWLGDEAPHG